MTSTRLTDRPEAARILVAAIAAQPEGAKLSIPQLRDALVNQGDVLDLIKRLVDKGALDRATLRPPAKAAAPTKRGFVVGDGEPSQLLFDALKVEGERRGLSVQKLSLAVWGNKARIYQLLKAKVVRRSTADKIRAWLEESRRSDAPDESPEPPQPQATREPALTLPPAPAPERPVTVAPPGVRKVRPYCEHPGNCIAPSRGGCPKCQPLSRVRARSDPSQADARRAIGARRAAMTEAERLLEKDPNATKGRNGGITTALNEIRLQRAAEERQESPLEQAKLALRRKGRVVHEASVTGGRSGFYLVSGERDGNGRLVEMSPAAVLDLAEKVTGQSFRRKAA